MNFSNLFIPKSRKVTFKATFTIHDLVNIPHITGTYYTKWKLKGSAGTAGGNHGKTDKIPINEHSVSWDQNFTIDSVTMVIGKDGELLPSILSFVIRKQETSIGKQQESIGNVNINLAEFAGSRITTRRYLLQDSKINSTIKISLELIYLKGEHVFKTPSSKSAGEITNIFQPQEITNSIAAAAGVNIGIGGGLSGTNNGANMNSVVSGGTNGSSLVNGNGSGNGSNGGGSVSGVSGNPNTSIGSGSSGFTGVVVGNELTSRNNPSSLNYQFMSLNHNIISKEGESATKVIDELFASNTLINE